MPDDDLNQNPSVESKIAKPRVIAVVVTVGLTPGQSHLNLTR
jgi:hypothetical protein